MPFWIAVCGGVYRLRAINDTQRCKTMTPARNGKWNWTLHINRYEEQQLHANIYKKNGAY